MDGLFTFPLIKHSIKHKTNTTFRKLNVFPFIRKNVNKHLLNLTHLIRKVFKFLSVEGNRSTFQNIVLLFVLFRILLQNEKIQEPSNLSDWVETHNFKLNSSGRYHFDQWHRLSPDLITGIQTLAFSLQNWSQLIEQFRTQHRLPDIQLHTVQQNVLKKYARGTYPETISPYVF